VECRKERKEGRNIERKVVKKENRNVRRKEGR
jgi:hypothetical protein